MTTSNPKTVDPLAAGDAEQAIAAQETLKIKWRAFLAGRKQAGNGRAEPAFVLPWQDKKTEAVGWIVIDRPINQIAGGGIFMHPDATEQETADIAYNMSRKFTVCDPQIGGAKAGIRFDHRDPRAKAVLTRFIQDNENTLRTMWVTAGDLNTDDAMIEEVIQSLGITTCQGALARKIAEKTGSKDRSQQLRSLLSEPASPFFPLIEGTVGYGLAASIERAIVYCGGVDNDVPRVALQGFGAVGSSAAFFLVEHKIAKVVALADKDGFIVNPDGIDIVALLKRRKERLHGELADAGDGERTECAKNFMCNMTRAELQQLAPFVCERTEERTSAGDEEFLVRFLASSDAEVISLCAGRYQFTKNVLNQGLKQGAWSGGGTMFVSPQDEPVKRRKARMMIVACGANNPFGVMSVEDGAASEDRSYAVVDALVRHGACVVPDWVANSGTAQLFHRALSLDFDLRKQPTELADAVLEACAVPIRAFLDRAFGEHARGKPAYLLYGCETLAAERLEKPIPLKPAALVCPNPARSIYALPPLDEALQLPLEERVRLCRSMMEEVIDCDGATLEDLLRSTPNPVAYDGFEPSGQMHIAQGVLKATIVNRMTRAGFTFIFWVADWFAWMNHKMGGDLDAIKTVGEYLIEVWRAAGMDMARVRFLWASEEFKKRHDEYWPLVIEIMSKYSVAQMMRCATIMGRQEGADLSASQLLYPAMQCADIFFLGVDVAQLGNDQRKVNVRAREFAGTDSGQSRGLNKPIVMSHHMIAGLKQGQDKMSKSDPDSAIFMEDSAATVKRKVRGAYCPPNVVEADPDNGVDANPVCDYIKHIVFPAEEDAGRLPIRIETRDGVLHQFGAFEEFAAAYKSGTLHPNDIKELLVERLNTYLEPVRQHFVVNSRARQLLERVRALSAKYKKKTDDTNAQ